MPANNALKVTDINFDTIKSNLKTFLSSQDTFKDYDFEGSGMSILLDVLAYNTYYQSFYTNMIANEMFLDSALLRSSVVSRAKMLGYTPRSARGADATIQVNITPTDSPDSITVAKNTEFTTSIDGIEYKFVVPVQQTIVGVNGTYSANLVISEGEPVTQRFTVSTNSPVRYILDNENVDTTSLTVAVQESTSNTTSNTYSLASNITNVGNNSPVYFIKENEEAYYELEFGDGVLGNRLRDGNIVIAEYRVVNGDDPNGANTFTSPATIGGYSNFTVTTQSEASGGAAIESINSIKFNAPKNFSAQNRAITANDYKNIILAENGDVQNISVWGGEDNDPPTFGKVFIAAKPVTGTVLSDTRKAAIVLSLEDRQVQSIEAEIVDPTYLYIVPNIQAFYDPEQTTQTPGEIVTKIKNAVTNFENTDLNNFQRTFRSSQFIRKIDDADASVTNSSSDFSMQFRINHTIGTAVTYTIKFNNEIFHPHDGHIYSISSSSFVLNGLTQFFDDDGFGNIRTYYLTGSTTRVITNANAGTVNYTTGDVTLLNFDPTSVTGSVLKINAKPKSTEIIPVRAQIPLIADTSITLIDDNTKRVVDTFSGNLTLGDTTIAESALSTVYY
jgi:hypothetical protein